MLTPAIIKSATAQPRAYKMFDAAGLFLFVAPSGTKSWRLKYRRDGREQLLTLGRYPALGLHEARALRDEARTQLATGEAISLDQNRARSLQSLSLAWLDHQRSRWSNAHAVDVSASLERDIFPKIGNRAALSITAAELLSVLQPIEKRGCIATARRIRQRLSAIFGFGISTGVCNSDPAAVLGRAMASSGLVSPHKALIDIDDCRTLLYATDHLVVSNKMIPLAHRFLALTAVRLDAVRGMRWCEVKGLDSEAPVWRVPPERMKLAKAKKAELRFGHIVPLSRAAASVLQRAASKSGCIDPDSKHLVFGGQRLDKRLGENALRDLISRTEFHDRHVPHGWRASFSTIMNEQLGQAWRSDIDRALAHVPKDKVEAAYNRADQIERRREVMDAWGALLSS